MGFSAYTPARRRRRKGSGSGSGSGGSTNTGTNTGTNTAPAPRPARVTEPPVGVSDTPVTMQTEQVEAVRRPSPAAVPASVAGSLPGHAPVVPLRRILRAFWPYAAPRRWWMLLVLALAAAEPVLMAVEIWLFKVVVDEVLVPQDFGPFPTIAAAYVGLTLLQAMLGAADRMLSTWLTQRFLVDLRSDLLRHLQRLPLDFFNRSRLGDLLARVSRRRVRHRVVPGLRHQPGADLRARAGGVHRRPVLAGPHAGAGLARRRPPVLAQLALLLPPDQGHLAREAAPLGLDQHLDRADPQHHAARARLRRGRAGGRALPRAGRGEVPRRDGLRPPALPLLAHRRADRARAARCPSSAPARGSSPAARSPSASCWRSSPSSPGCTVRCAVSAAPSPRRTPPSAGAERVLELLAEPPLPADRPGALVLERPRGEVRIEHVGHTYDGQERSALTDVSFMLHPGR